MCNSCDNSTSNDKTQNSTAVETISENKTVSISKEQYDYLVSQNNWLERQLKVTEKDRDAAKCGCAWYAGTLLEVCNNKEMQRDEIIAAFHKATIESLNAYSK